jgi:hypothetical protein
MKKRALKRATKRGRKRATKKEREPVTRCSGGPADLVRRVSPKDDARHGPPPPPKKGRKNARTVQGFGVRSQGRTRFRDDHMAGTYEGFDWVIHSEGDGLFQWAIGSLHGFSGPTLADVLRTMKKAVAIRAKILDQYGEVSPESLHSLRLLLRWEQRLSKGRLRIDGPYSDGHYEVREVEP